MASSGREERRRRIVERGSDRLALITGQRKSLEDIPSVPTPSTSSLSPQPHPHPQPQIQNRGDITTDDKEIADDIRSANKIETYHPKPKIDVPARKAPVAQIKPTFFSSHRINSCILASEETRAICSIVITILAIFAYIDFPLFGLNIVSSENMMISRPITTIMLTDLTVVLARLFHEKQEGDDGAEVNRENPDGAVILLERGLALYNGIRGLSIDCSIYLVIIICIVSLF